VTPISRLAVPVLAATLVVLQPLPPTAHAAGGPGGLARAVEALAPGATALPNGFRFRIEEVVVSVLADEAAGLLRVVARAGDLSDRDLGLVASALGPDLVPDLAARVVSVRGLMCSAVLAPLRGVTEPVLRRAVEGAVLVAREAARAPDPAGGLRTDPAPGAGLPPPGAGASPWAPAAR